jgi:hypothetical protein
MSLTDPHEKWVWSEQQQRYYNTGAYNSECLQDSQHCTVLTFIFPGTINEWQGQTWAPVGFTPPVGSYTQPDAYGVINQGISPSAHSSTQSSRKDSAHTSPFPSITTRDHARRYRYQAHGQTANSSGTYGVDLTKPLHYEPADQSKDAPTSPSYLGI